MYLLFFLKGIALGIALAAPVGPIGVLCIRKTVHYGKLSGLFSGLGAACADTIYAIIAAFGLTIISDVLLQEELQFWLRLSGGAFLIFLGVKTFVENPAHEELEVPKVNHKTLLADFFTAFFLTISNPITIVAFLAVFAGFGLTQYSGGYASAGSLVIGVLLGSTLWWLILSEGVTRFRKKVNHKVMRGINRIAGVLICIFGLVAWSSLYWKF